MEGMQNGQGLGMGGQMGADVTSVTAAQAVRSLLNRSTLADWSLHRCLCSDVAIHAEDVSFHYNHRWPC